MTNEQLELIVEALKDEDVSNLFIQRLVPGQAGLENLAIGNGWIRWIPSPISIPAEFDVEDFQKAFKAGNAKTHTFILDPKD